MTDYHARIEQLLAELEDEAGQAIAVLTADLPYDLPDIDPLPWWV